MERGRSTGGIITLLELIEEHPAELAYDFRSRFSLGIDDIGTKVGWHEAFLLVTILMRDTSSWLQAAYNDWSHPVSMEWIMLVQQFDLHALVNSKRKPKPTKMPWQAPIRSGKPTIPEDEVRRILDAMRPQGE